MDVPKISIITPSYNQGQFLEETILSVLNQNYPNLEYIIMDGGSTDNSVEIIKKYEDRLAYWVSKPDKGQTEAINKGFRRSRGDILSWLNSDDLLLPGALSAVAQCFGKHPEAGFVYGDYQMIDQAGRVLFQRLVTEYDFGVLVYGRSLMTQPATFFRNSVIEQIGHLDERFDFCMDLEFWIRAAVQGIVFQSLRVPLAANRLHGEAKTSTQRYKLIEQHLQIVKKYYKIRGGLWGFYIANLYNRARGVLRRIKQRGNWGILQATRARKSIRLEK